MDNRRKGVPTSACFSAEIRLESGMHAYGGGLSMLAGDTIRSAAGLGVPLAEVALLHRKGYLRRSFRDGRRIEGHIEGISAGGVGNDHKAGRQDRDRDAGSPYAKLEEAVIPTFCRDRDRYLDGMRHAMALNGSFFQYSAHGAAMRRPGLSVRRMGNHG